jgi:hypothetical protein
MAQTADDMQRLISICLANHVALEKVQTDLSQIKDLLQARGGKNTAQQKKSARNETQNIRARANGVRTGR